MSFEDLNKQIIECEKCPDLVRSRKLYPHGKPALGYGNKASKIMFVGEVKLIEPLLPCGKTSRQKNREWYKIHKKYDEEKC